MVTSVRIYINVPSGLDSYTGIQPITVGVPFARDVLKEGDGVALFDQNNISISGQFEVTATWDPLTIHGTSVKWLLVDFLVQITDGQPQEVYLKYGSGISISAPIVSYASITSSTPLDVSINTGSISLSIGYNSGMLGTFSLTAVVTGTPFVFTAGEDPFEVHIEKNGPIRSVVRVDTDYVNDGYTAVAQSSTRYRFWEGLSMVKIYHTMIWDRDSSVKIKELKFTRTVDSSSTFKIGFTPDSVYDHSVNTVGRQINYNSVKWDNTTTVSGKLDGYIHATNAGNPVFMGLRWPWQQFPTGFQYQSGTASVLLIGPTPSTPQSLYLTDIAPANVLALQPDPFTPNAQYGGNGFGWEAGRGQSITVGGAQVAGYSTLNDIVTPALISPRGAARTYEITLWFGDSDVPNDIKNILIQQPIYGYIDPSFAVLAGIPTPATAKSDIVYPEMETALERVFNFTTKTLASDAERAGNSSFGTWNWGDIQWQWFGSYYVTYRYWMNQGKGYGVVPWLLFLRSGDRQYLEFGECNSRHVMDVDTCHVPETGQFMDEPHATDFKMRGGCYSYSELHWSFGPYGGVGETITPDSEYLLYYYYLTGYERAKDVIRERILCTQKSRWGLAGVGSLDYFYPLNSTILAGAGRNLYNMLRELCCLYEASWNDSDPDVIDFSPDLGEWATNTLTNTLFAQIENLDVYDGYLFPGITSPHYLDHSLIIANRVLGSTTAITALKNWENLWLGRSYVDGFEDGYYGQAYGPHAIWALAEFQKTYNSTVISDEILGLLNSRVNTIITTEPPPYAGNTTFVGLGCYDVETGPYIRDIVAGLWALRNFPPSLSTNFYPISYISAQLTSGGSFKSIIFIKKSNGNSSVTITLHFHMGNSSVDLLSGYSATIYRPNGTSLGTTNFTILATFFNTFGHESVTLTIPINQPDGVYGISIIGPSVGGRMTPVRAVTSVSTKIVHYMPNSQIGSLIFTGGGGRVWLHPSPASTVIFTTFSAEVARTAAYDINNNLVAEAQISSVTGTSPTFEPLSFVPSDSNALYFVVCGYYQPNRVFRFTGIRPYLSATSDDWFDPLVEAPALIAALGLSDT